MRRGVPGAGILLLAVLAAAPLARQRQSYAAAGRYFPAKGSWETRPPAELGFDPAKLDAAMQYSMQNQNPNTRNLTPDSSLPRGGP
jgi:hypothetical protein